MTENNSTALVVFQSLEEQDLLHRSVKKHKRNSQGRDDVGTEHRRDPQGREDVDMETPSEEQRPSGNAWQQQSFVDAVKGKKTAVSFYTGEGEEDALDDLGLADIMQEQDHIEAGELCAYVDIPWESYKLSWKKWRRALILKTLGRNFSFRLLAPRIKQAWQLEHDCDLIELDKGYMVARFYTREDYLKALEGGPWTIFGHYLTVSKWRPNFRPTLTSPPSTIAWIRVPGFPVEMLDADHLLGVGNAVGRAIKADPNIDDMIKGRYARVCVELNLMNFLMPTVVVWGKKYSVEYEGLHRICFQCGRYGHNREQCGKSETSNKDGDTNPRTENSAPMCSTVAQPFGPWMLPAHVRRKNQQFQARMKRQSEMLASSQNRARHSDCGRSIAQKIRPDSGSNDSPDPNTQFGPTNTYSEPKKMATSQPTQQRALELADNGAGVPSRFTILATMPDDSGEQASQLEGLTRRTIQTTSVVNDNSHGIPQTNANKGMNKGNKAGKAAQQRQVATEDHGGHLAQLEFLKKQIQNIPYMSTSNGHVKAHIKLEKGIQMPARGGALPDGHKKKSQPALVPTSGSVNINFQSSKPQSTGQPNTSHETFPPKPVGSVASDCSTYPSR